MPVRHTSPHSARLVVVALCLMVCAVPLVYLPEIYAYVLIPKLFALHLCIALTCLGWLLHTRWGRDVRLISSPLFLPALCFMGVALLSAPATTHPLDTLVELVNQAALIVLFFVVANVLSVQRLQPILWTNAAAGLAVALIGILQYHDLAFVDIPTNGHPSATFGYRNLAAMYLVCAIPLTGLLFLTSRRWAGLLLSGLSATLMGVYLVYTRTRSAWVGAAVAMICASALMVFWPGLRRPVLEAVRSGLERGKRVLALGFGVLFIVLSVLPARFQETGPQGNYSFYTKAGIVSTASSIVEEGEDKGRLAMWRNTLRLGADHPLLGVGPGGWKRAYPPYDRGVAITVDTSPNRPHNDYLWIASEYGLIGLGIYVWLLVTVFRCFLSMARSPERFSRIAALMFTLSLLATMGDAFFNFPREWPQATMFPYLLFGVAASATARRRDVRCPRAFGPLLLGLLLVISVSGAALSWCRIEFDRHYLRALNRVGPPGDWSAVLTEAQRALEYGTFLPHILVIKGHALEKLNDYAEAEVAYRQALAYTPHSWYAHAGLCELHLQQGRIEDALIHGRAALSIFSDHADTHSNLGTILVAKGDLDGALSEYRQAVKIDPDLAGAHYNLGTVLTARGDLDGALSAYRQALRIKPDHASAHDNLGVVLSARGDLDGALSAYRQALRIKPDHAIAHYHMGDALAARGDLNGAVQEFHTCIRLTTSEQIKQAAEDRIRKLGGIP